jgi:hypothetical protein
MVVDSRRRRKVELAGEDEKSLRIVRLVESHENRVLVENTAQAPQTSKTNWYLFHD